MSEKKPTPVLTQRTSRKCPVCGQKAYSRGGIHPQCAMALADAPRKALLLAQKKAAAQVAAKIDKSPPAKLALWEKLCPQCGSRLPARKATCTCGHRFNAS
jgi:hypothetical protein